MDDININNKTAVVDKPAPSVGPSSSPIGLGHQKEQEPSSSTDIQPSQSEIKLHEEIKEAGVEKISDTPHLTEDAKVVGIEHAGESTPVQTQSLGTVKLPMSDKEARQIIKTIKPDNSIFGLAILVLKYVKRTMLRK